MNSLPTQELIRLLKELPIKNRRNYIRAGKLLGELAERIDTLCAADLDAIQACIAAVVVYPAQCIIVERLTASE